MQPLLVLLAGRLKQRSRQRLGELDFSLAARALNDRLGHAGLTSEKDTRRSQLPILIAGSRLVTPVGGCSKRLVFAGQEENPMFWIAAAPELDLAQHEIRIWDSLRDERRIID